MDKCGCLEIRNWLDDAISGNLPDCSKLIGWAKIAFVHAFNFLLNSEMNYTKAICMNFIHYTLSDLSLF